MDGTKLFHTNQLPSIYIAKIFFTEIQVSPFKNDHSFSWAAHSESTTRLLPAKKGMCTQSQQVQDQKERNYYTSNTEDILTCRRYTTLLK